VATDRQHPCPICKAPVSRDAKAYPFCGEHCRTIDLGNWLDGKYALTEDGEAAEE
jgi:endogenous inhibitor of DNA gyrase (YacG/DUF329 family)